MAELDLEAAKRRKPVTEIMQLIHRYARDWLDLPHPEAACDEIEDMIAAIAAEVERLRAALADEQAIHAKTFDNFEAFAESALEQTQVLTAGLAWVAEEYRQCIVSARCTHDAGHFERCNGRAEAYRLLADKVAAAAGLSPPDWDQIRHEVPADGIYRTEASGG